jgi:hypothetical protein
MIYANVVERGKLLYRDKYWICQSNEIEDDDLQHKKLTVQSKWFSLLFNKTFGKKGLRELQIGN